MKHLCLILLSVLSISLSAFGQETARPLTDTEIERRVAIMDIEGKYYENVVVTLKSTSPDYFFTDKYKVKVKIVDEKGKTIWKKTLKSVFLYVFSDGQVQVGKQNFDQIVIHKSSTTGEFFGKIREKKGIY